VGRDAAPTSPTLLARYARLVVRRRKAFLVGYLVLVLLAGGIGMQVLPVLQAEGFDNPSSQSAEVAQLLERDFDTRQPVAVIGATGAGSIDSPETTAAAKRLVAELQRQAGVDEVVSYWTAGRPAALRGNDDKTGEILVYSTAPTSWPWLDS
jgi:RND superfamily putative drug exporter